VDTSEARRRVVAPSETAVAPTPTVPDGAPKTDGQGSTTADTHGTESAPVGSLIRSSRWLVAGAYVTSVAVLAYLYGLFPGDRSMPLITVVGIEGWVDCLKDGLNPCTYLGYPEGVRLSLSTSVVLGARWLGAFGFGVPAALSLMALLCLAAGVGALWVLIYRMMSNHLVSLLAVALYFGSPMLVGHIGLVSIFYGFLLLPLPVLLAYEAVHAADRVASTIALTAGLFAVGLVLIYCDPYPYVIATTCAGFVLVAGLLRDVLAKRWRPAIGIVCALAGAALPALVYRSLEAGSGLEIVMPQDFYRAEGADVETMLVPTRSQLIGSLLGVPVHRWKPTEFYGNVTHLTAVWLGPVLLITAVIGGVLLFRRRSRRWIAAGLAVLAFGCLMVGLGPSFKWLDRSQQPIGDARREFEDYLMPVDQVTATFPWSGLYGRQPLASMRYVYRWHAGLRLVACIFAAGAVAALAERRKVLAIGLASILVLESTPMALLHRPRSASLDHDQLQRFDADTEAVFNGAFQRGERVLSLPTSNDYLMEVIAPRYRLFAYNIAFDKELTRIRPLQPPPITSAEAAFDEQLLRRPAVCQIFRDDLLDALVFTEFYPQWNAYRWPPYKKDRRLLRAMYEQVGLTGDPAFVIDDRDLAVIVRPVAGGECAPPSR
jgi:hypothetical protein